MLNSPLCVSGITALISRLDYLLNITGKHLSCHHRFEIPWLWLAEVRMRVQVWGGSQEEEATCIESLQHPIFLFVLIWSSGTQWYILFFYIVFEVLAMERYDNNDTISGSWVVLSLANNIDRAAISSRRKKIQPFFFRLMKIAPWSSPLTTGTGVAFFNEIHLARSNISISRFEFPHIPSFSIRAARTTKREDFNHYTISKLLAQ